MMFRSLASAITGLALIASGISAASAASGANSGRLTTGADIRPTTNGDRSTYDLATSRRYARVSYFENCQTYISDHRDGVVRNMIVNCGVRKAVGRLYFRCEDRYFNLSYMFDINSDATLGSQIDVLEIPPNMQSVSETDFRRLCSSDAEYRYSFFEAMSN
ncbi:MAG: hypothetical protein RKE49_09010 [Oceanicaulis sp.]